jgi:hypothetical protein
MHGAHIKQVARGGMTWAFGDGDLKANLRLQAAWDQAFVDRHFQARHGFRGQRKLLLSNVLALALAAEDMQRRNDTRKIAVVVAGASPGTHLPVLMRHLRTSNIADRLEVHLYDPKPLHRAVAGAVRADGRMRFTQDKFRDAHALEWSRRDPAETCLVFLSDIRSDIHGKQAHVRADEDKIGEDMHMQKQWVETMRPEYSMLKFHAQHATRDNPSVAPGFSYLAGDLYKQTDIDLFSAECRLFVTQADIREKAYSTADIERHMFFHNQTLRPTTFTVSGGKRLQFDEAFQFHVAQLAERVLGVDAGMLLAEARRKLQVDPIAFSWTPPACSRVQGMLRGMQAHL